MQLNDEQALNHKYLSAESFPIIVILRDPCHARSLGQRSTRLRGLSLKKKTIIKIVLDLQNSPLKCYSDVCYKVHIPPKTVYAFSVTQACMCMVSMATN